MKTRMAENANIKENEIQKEIKKRDRGRNRR